ncbi:MAG: rhomboid family intramembrane serine protease [bacterium]
MESRRPWLEPAKAWRPVATYTLLGTMAGVYVLQLLTVDAAGSNTWGLGRAFLWHGLPHHVPDFLFIINTDWMWRPWTLATSTLSHDFADANHLLFNGLFLFFFGPAVEHILGRLRYVVLFFVAGAASGVVQVHAVAFDASHDPLLFIPNGGALGASGALMALFGVLMVVTPMQKVSLFFVLPVPLWAAGIGYAALDLLGVVSPPAGGNIGHFAHLSGMAIGLGYGAWVKADWKRRGLRLVYQ